MEKLATGSRKTANSQEGRVAAPVPTGDERLSKLEVSMMQLIERQQIAEDQLNRRMDELLQAVDKTGGSIKKSPSVSEHSDSVSEHSGKEVNSQWSRWYHYFKMYDASLQHVPGKSHVALDASTRIGREPRSPGSFHYSSTLSLRKKVVLGIG